MRDAGADDIGVHVSSSRVGGPAALVEGQGEGKRESRKGKVGWLGRWSCGAAELRDCGGGRFERAGVRGWRRESGSAMTS